MTEQKRIKDIRKAEADSHLQMYSEHELFAEGSWLSRPVKTVMDLVPYFSTYSSIRALDLGCGVGRNSIPIAKAFSQIPCTVDSVDILPYAIEKLLDNARIHGVIGSICGITRSIEEYAIPKNTYDLVIAVSALEHICSHDAWITKLQEIKNGLRSGGVACLIISTDIVETDLLTGEALSPQFELNLSAETLREDIRDCFVGFSIAKETCLPQQYVIPRDGRQVSLSASVYTFIIKREHANNETSN